MLLQEQIINLNSYSDICRLLNLPINGSGLKKAKEAVKDLNTNHFGKRIRQTKYQILEKECPVCRNIFQTKNDRDERSTCSHACANTYFRSGENNPNWKGSNYYYRKMAFENFNHKCNRCQWSEVKEILEVHHKDRNHQNNELENLELLCPNCHQLEHYLNQDGRWAYNIKRKSE